jgi:predicted Fe-S protein YdhL (DUF1289 family)
MTDAYVQMDDNTKSTVTSPCIRNCCLDDKDICVGCFRSIDDILVWSKCSDAKKAEIIKQADKRRINYQIKYPFKL